MNANSTAQKISGPMPLAARLFLGAVIVLGLAVLANSWILIFSAPPGWMVLAALTVAVSIVGFHIPLPDGKRGVMSISLADCFSVAGFLLYGPAGGVVMAALEGVVGNINFKTTGLTRWLFNIAQQGLVIYLVARFFYFFSGASAPLRAESLADLGVLAALVVSVFLQMALNSGLVMTAMALAGKQALFASWRRRCLALLPVSALSALTAVLILVCFNELNLAALAAALVLALCLYYAHQLSRTLHRVQGISQARANLYVAVFVTAGFGVSSYSLRQVLDNPLLEWALLLGLTALASIKPVYLQAAPDRGVVVNFAAMFVFAGVLLVGPMQAAALSLVFSAVTAWQSREAIRGLPKILFNVFHLPVVVLAAASCFRWLQPDPISLGLPLFLALGACALLYTMFNAGAVTAAIRLSSGCWPRVSFYNGLPSEALTTLAEAAAGLAVFMVFRGVSPLSLLALAAALGGLLLVQRRNLIRLRSAQGGM